jgi:hypothetical protein
MGGTQPGAPVRCTYCGGRRGGRLLEIELRGVRYDYCDAACATAHRQAVELTRLLCVGCDEDAVGDSGLCDVHLLALDAETVQGAPVTWRRAG